MPDLQLTREGTQRAVAHGVGVILLGTGIRDFAVPILWLFSQVRSSGLGGLESELFLSIAVTTIGPSIRIGLAVLLLFRPRLLGLLRDLDGPQLIRITDAAFWSECTRVLGVVWAILGVQHILRGLSEQSYGFDDGLESTWPLVASGLLVTVLAGTAAAWPDRVVRVIGIRSNKQKLGNGGPVADKVAHSAAIGSGMLVVAVIAAWEAAQTTTDWFASDFGYLDNLMVSGPVLIIAILGMTRLRNRLSRLLWDGSVACCGTCGLRLNEIGDATNCPECLQPVTPYADDDVEPGETAPSLFRNLTRLLAVQIACQTLPTVLFVLLTAPPSFEYYPTYAGRILIYAHSILLALLGMVMPLVPGELRKLATIGNQRLIARCKRMTIVLLGMWMMISGASSVLLPFGLKLRQAPVTDSYPDFSPDSAPFLVLGWVGLMVGGLMVLVRGAATAPERS